MKRKYVCISWAVLVCSVMIIFSSCEKYLDVKPDVAITTVETLKDIRALLDNENRVNQTYPGLVELGTDDYYLNYEQISSQYQLFQDVYFWNKEFVNTSNGNWQNSYGTILVANVVMESLDRISTNDDVLKSTLLGEAHFIRGLSFYYLALVYSDTYQKGNDNESSGLPLRLTSDFNLKVKRSTLKETFELIISDLKLAMELLPDQVIVKTRPSKVAAMAALAKIYLYMQDYEQAELYASKVYGLMNNLIDFNQLDVTSNRPFAALHEEMIYLAYSMEGAELLNEDDVNISPALYRQYDLDDLRKFIYFKDKGEGVIGFKGNYVGNFSTYFAGLSTNEIYLILAECKIRRGRKMEGLQFMEKLLINRYRQGIYTVPQFNDDNSALKYVFTERRKELLFRGVRWSDLKRLNLDPNFATTLKRELNIAGDLKEFNLQPNDRRYIYPIPENAIVLGSLEQNVR